MGQGVVERGMGGLEDAGEGPSDEDVPEMICIAIDP